jgi:hypothetical protein
MTRSELTERILRALADSPTDPIFWSFEEIHDVLQDGQEMLAEEVQALRRTVFVPWRPGALLYSLGSLADECMAIARVWRSDTHERLDATTLTALGYTPWMSQPGPEARVWFPMSWHAFGVYPHAGQGVGSFEVDYLAWPGRLVDDGDEPECPEPDQDALVSYGVYYGLLKQWDWVRAQDLWQQFIARWSDAEGRTGSRQLQARPWQRGVSRDARLHRS